MRNLRSLGQSSNLSIGSMDVSLAARKSVIVAALAICGASALNAANLVKNGDFEQAQHRAAGPRRPELRARHADRRPTENPRPGRDRA